MYNKEFLQTLCMADGISGDEQEIRKIILNEIKPFADEVKTDNLGNLIVFKKGEQRPKNKLMISAHMDEVGFIVTSVTSDGYIKFEEVGGIDRRVILGKRVKIGDNKINGVVGVKPIHLCSGDEGKKVPEVSAMYIDIGADSKEEALKVISLGDSISFSSVCEFTDEKIKAKAIDDRAGCYIMCELIKSNLKYDTYFTFVVQEEVGLRGARTAAYTVNPDFAIVLESTTAADLFDVSYEKQVCNLSEGAVISFMDRSTLYDKELYKLCFETANENNIKLQTKRAVAGGNDSGAIHISRGGVRTIAVSLPCRYLHSNISMISVDDLNSAMQLVPKLAEKISGEL